MAKAYRLLRAVLMTAVDEDRILQCNPCRVLHFYDLRHTGNTLAARTPGTSLRDLMAPMGHDSVRAAIIYQHATGEADRPSPTRCRRDAGRRGHHRHGWRRPGRRGSGCADPRRLMAR